MRESDVLCLLRDDYKYKLVIEASNCQKGIKRSRQEDDGVASSSKKLKSDHDSCLKSKDERKRRSLLDEHSKKSVKRKLDKEEVDESLTKQPKFDLDLSNEGDLPDEDVDTDDDSEHSMSVEEKLKKLKQTFGCYTSKNEENREVRSNPANEIKATEKSFWHEGKRLLVYSSQGLLSSEKVHNQLSSWEATIANKNNNVNKLTLLT